MTRYLLLLILAWGLLGAPALCTAGTLLHECECGASYDCAHEEECSDDPCADGSAWLNANGMEFDHFLAEAIHGSGAFLAAYAAGMTAPQTTTLAKRPFPPGQHPLLI